MKWHCDYLLGILLVVLPFVVGLASLKWVALILGVVLLVHTYIGAKCPVCGPKAKAAS